MPQSESILPLLVLCCKPLTDRSHPSNPLLAAPRTPCCPPALPPPFCSTLSSFLSILFSFLLVFQSPFSLLDSLISISSLSFSSLHPAAFTKALFLSIHWRLVWSRTHARCSALRDRLTAHWGKTR